MSDVDKLRNEYYQKLRESGFTDIENEKGELITHHSSYEFSHRIGFRLELFTHIRDYYSWAYEQSVWKEFKSDTDKEIWTLHAQGKSSRFISKRVRFDQTWICRKIKQIRKYLLSSK